MKNPKYVYVLYVILMDTAYSLLIADVSHIIFVVTCNGHAIHRTQSISACSILPEIPKYGST